MVEQGVDGAQARGGDQDAPHPAAQQFAGGDPQGGGLAATAVGDDDQRPTGTPPGGAQDGRHRLALILGPTKAVQVLRGSAGVAGRVRVHPGR